MVEQDLVEWLRANQYLWLRSTKEYKKKKDAWQMKAEELDIKLVHLEKWWKNLKDWYVKLKKKKSGQSTKPLTGREKWVLKNLSFYHTQVQVDVPDTLNIMGRSASTSSSAAAAMTSRPSDDEECGLDVLSDLEAQEALMMATKTPTKQKTRKLKSDEDWSVKLMQHLEDNQKLLERVLLPQQQSAREAFIRYASECLRSASDEDFTLLQDSFNEAMKACKTRSVANQAASSQPPPPTRTLNEPQQSSTTSAPTQISTPPMVSTPILQNLTPLSSLQRMLFSNSPHYYLGMDHPSQPQFIAESPSQMSSLTTPQAPPCAQGSTQEEEDVLK